MAPKPKTHFSIPLKKTADAVTPALQGRRETRTTESIPLDHASRRVNSGSLHKGNKYAQTAKVSSASDDTVETYPRLFIEPKYASEDSDDSDDDDACGKASNVCFSGSSDSVNYAHYIIDAYGPMASETCTIS